MKLYLSKTHADQDGPFAEEGKLGIIYSSKDSILKLCDFFEQVKKNVQQNDNCHMHFRDSFQQWKKEEHIDLEINIDL